MTNTQSVFCPNQVTAYICDCPRMANKKKKRKNKMKHLEQKRKETILAKTGLYRIAVMILIHFIRPRSPYQIALVL